MYQAVVLYLLKLSTTEGTLRYTECTSCVGKAVALYLLKFSTTEGTLRYTECTPFVPKVELLYQQELQGLRIHFGTYSVPLCAKSCGTGPTAAFYH